MVLSTALEAINHHLVELYAGEKPLTHLLSDLCLVDSLQRVNDAQSDNLLMIAESVNLQRLSNNPVKLTTEDLHRLLLRS